MADPVPLQTVISDVRERTEKVYLSADEHSNGDHHRRWKAIREGEAELAEYLRVTYGALIRANGETNMIRMCMGYIHTIYFIYHNTDFIQCLANITATIN